MAIKIHNSTPQAILLGVDDQSVPPLLIEPEANPQHLPLVYSFMEKGDPDQNYVVTSGSMTQTFGTEFLDPKSKFATHVTPYIRGFYSLGQMVMLQRLKPDDASTAWLRFSVEVTEGPVREWDAKEEKYVEVEGEKGYSLRWITGPATEDKSRDDKLDPVTAAMRRRQKEFGQGYDIGSIASPDQTDSALTGTTVSDGQASMVYPIFDIQVTDFGSYGNNLGVRLSCPNMTSNIAPDRQLFERTLTRMFRIEMIRRRNARSTAVTVKNNYGEATTDFSFRHDAKNPMLDDQDLAMSSMLLDQYRDTNTDGGRVPRFGPFNNLKVYHENIDALCKMLFIREREYDNKVFAKLEQAYTNRFNELISEGKTKQEIAALTNDPILNEYHEVMANKKHVKGRRIHEYNPNEHDEEVFKHQHHQIDIFTAMSFYGRPYYTISMKDYRTSMGETVAMMDEYTAHWARGGNDGTMNNKVYNELVARKLEAFEDASNEMLSIAKYPFSVFYDTGFPMEVKKLFHILPKVRKDVSVCLSTHIAPEDENTRNASADGFPGVKPLSRREEVGVVASLSSHMRAFPESEVYGTQALRANIIMGCGFIVDSEWKGLVPFNYELAMKRARFMGAPNGKLRPDLGYDQDGIKIVEFMKAWDDKKIWSPHEVNELNWTRGASYVTYYDRSRLFFPAVRSIYREERSVLASDINMLIVTDLEKVCYRVWRRLTGNAKLSNAQFEELSNQYILEAVEGAYDGRVKIVPDTKLTRYDENRGYSWTCNIHVYMPNMKTVGVYTIVAHRIDSEGGN